MLSIEVESDPVPDIEGEARKEVRGVMRRAARLLPAELARSGDIPVDSGELRASFEAEADRDDVEVGNRADHAAAVLLRRTYPRGGQNPNYGAVTRALERVWSRVVDRAAR